VLVGRIAMTLAAGRKATVRFRLNRHARTLLRRGRPLRIAMSLRIHGAASLTMYRTVTVRAS
jgi:hypothetical protein